MFKKFCIGLLLIGATLVYAQDPVFPPHTPVPGGVAIIPLKALEQNKTAPKVTFEKNRVMVLRRRDAWYAIVGIPLNQEPGDTKITVEDTDAQIHYPFTVKPKTYRTEHITLKDTEKVTPGRKNQKRIAQEYRKVRKLYQTWTNTVPATFKFPLPTSGRKSSSFGLRRSFNGVLKNPHKGMDIAALTGTPVLAPAPGRVIGVGNHFYSGRVIFIDHGMGLISYYAHLNKIFVKPGQKITLNQKIGLVGQTGRATGPHLHWGIILNATSIDPELFLKKPEPAVLLQAPE